MARKNSGSPYNLRPRSKVVRAINPASLPTTSFSRLEIAEMKKTIAQGQKLSIAEAGDLGERLGGLNKEDRKKYFKQRSADLGRVYIPRKPVSDEERKRTRELNILRVAEKGLSYLNDPANGEAKYELVNPVASNFFFTYKGGPGPCGARHCNFEAKRIDAHEAKPELFFLEIIEKVPGKQKITHCRSLGFSGTKAAATGLKGCKVCSSINHPKNVRFTTR